MLVNPPFSGAQSIIQPFGANPGNSAGLGCGGVPMRGHEGIDFALAVGTPILAVQAGKVAAAAHNERFGNFVILEHEWGQSLYANLATRSVAGGANVTAGTSVGTSGKAGNTAQLHFGIRINPYSVADGWCGYSDPAPYLDRLTKPRGPIMGPHILGGAHRHFPVLQEWQPRLVLVVDPNPEEMRELRRICPNTVIIGRPYVPDGEVSDRIQQNPTAAAQWAHEIVLSRLNPYVDYWQVANEVMQSAESLPKLVNFELARMSLAEGSGYRCAIFAFSVGNPDLPEDDRMAVWSMTYPALQRAENNGHIVAVHQYGAPSLKEPTVDWHAHRLEHQVLRRMPFKRLQFAVTEFGLDGLLVGPDPKGWQQLTNARDYVDQIKRAGAYTERFSGRILGYALYSLGVTGPWGTYDIDGEVATMLAKESERGTWSQVTVAGGGLETSEGDRSTAPGGAATSIPGVPTAPINRRITNWFDHYNFAIKSVAERPDDPQPLQGEANVTYYIKDVFTTMNGSWEASDTPGGIPQWARDSYLSSDFVDAGADHNLFACVLDKNGEKVFDRQIRFWSDGFAQLGNPDYDKYVIDKTRTPSGWVGMVIFSSSNFVPERGESGPWCWTAAGRAEVMTGGGLPANHHMTTFVVWQAVEDEGETPDPPDPPNPPDPPDPNPPDPTPPVDRTLGKWIDDLNLGVKTIAERPDNPPGEWAYVIKQVFTTRDGSWEPSDAFGAVEQWARDAWLRPWGAPDYFDDAGADHHIFAAVIGLDGKLIRDCDVRYWSDGFAQLGNPNYSGYVLRQTKTQSGWANIPMDGGANYYPENGQQGPWCWAPAGASEVIVGGGMPANQHISIFVVWQQVKRAIIDIPDGNDVFLPWVSQTSPERPLPEIDPNMEGDLPTPEIEPMPSDPVDADDPGVRILHEDAWLRVGIESAHDTDLAMYARRVGLGMPVTHEFESGDLIAQGFAGGIAFKSRDATSSIRHVAW